MEQAWRLRLWARFFLYGETDNLRAMEEDGLLTHTVFSEVPPRVEYSLSALGETMRPIIKHMEKWGLAYKCKLNASSR